MSSKAGFEDCYCIIEHRIFSFWRTWILHLQQEGSLCAQHCLNNLLQGEYFTPVDLSSIAHQLDEEERMRMAEGGVASEEYRTFLQVRDMDWQSLTWIVLFVWSVIQMLP